MNSVKRAIVEVHKCTAFCTDLGLALTAATPEESVRDLADKIRQRDDGPYAIVLPYLGESFSVHWEDLKLPKPKEEDEFEYAQKISHRLQKDVSND